MDSNDRNGDQFLEITLSNRHIIKKNLFMATPLVGEELNQPEQKNGG